MVLAKVLNSRFQKDYDNDPWISWPLDPYIKMDFGFTSQTNSDRAMANAGYRSCIGNNTTTKTTKLRLTFKHMTSLV